jgi:hemoglobin
MNTPTAHQILALLLSAVLAAVTGGCRGGAGKPQQEDFFTSGSREADQRAMQRMAKEKQLAGDEAQTNVKEAKPGEEGTGEAARVKGKTTLFDRLGGQDGINAIIDDFTQRALEDPRVNWQRQGTERGGFFRRNKSVAWNATPENVATLKKHLSQFLALATGGPAEYEGKSIKAAHADMRITNPEFDAVIGDLKASLDKLQIPDQEQKELLSIIESTRPQIVTIR